MGYEVDVAPRPRSIDPSRRRIAAAVTVYHELTHPAQMESGDDSKLDLQMDDTGGVNFIGKPWGSHRPRGTRSEEEGQT
jgi:hypothetical protein